MIEKREGCVLKFEYNVEIMYCRDHMLAKEGSMAKIQFDEFIDVIAKKYTDKFLAFDWGKERVDTFLGNVCIEMKITNCCGK